MVIGGCLFSAQGSTYNAEINAMFTVRSFVRSYYVYVLKAVDGFE